MSQKICPLRITSGRERRPLGRRKGRGWQCLPKSLAAIVSKVDALVKDFADLKVHVVGDQDRRKSQLWLRANFWCTTCGKISHANTECTATRSSYLETQSLTLRKELGVASLLGPKLKCPKMTLKNDMQKGKGNCKRLRLWRLLVDKVDCKP